MDVREYMQRDFQLLEKHVLDVEKAYEHKDPGKTLDQAKDMFEAFTRRFALEDFLLSKVDKGANSTDIMKSFLAKRRVIREQLEDMLMLHVSEPDFMAEIQSVLKKCESHILFLKDEFYPNFLNKLTSEQMSYLGTALEGKLHNTTFH